MAEIVTLKSGHPLVGTWRDADEDYGTSIRFTVRGVGANFEVAGLDTHDGEKLSISNIRWDGRVLRFDSFVPSTGHQVQYAFEVASPSEVLIRATRSERWIRADATA
jgi:hypothetical protein